MSSLKFGHKFYTLLLFFCVSVKMSTWKNGQNKAVIMHYCHCKELVTLKLKANIYLESQTGGKAVGRDG